MEEQANETDKILLFEILKYWSYFDMTIVRRIVITIKKFLSEFQKISSFGFIISEDFKLS